MLIYYTLAVSTPNLIKIVEAMETQKSIPRGHTSGLLICLKCGTPMIKRFTILKNGKTVMNETL